MKKHVEWTGVGKGTMRAKVAGGWILLCCDESSDTGDVISQSMVFIPDAKHEWELDEFEPS